MVGNPTKDESSRTGNRNNIADEARRHENQFQKFEEVD